MTRIILSLRCGRTVAMALAALLLSACLFGCSGGAMDAPAVLGFGPTAGKDVPANAPVTISFDRDMIAPLVERALTIEPPVEGSISWKGSTLQFAPLTGWARGTRYKISLDSSARGINLQSLKDAVTFEFMTASDLSVVSAQPGNGATDVASNGFVVVQFSYPMVSLGTTSGEPAPVRLDPPVQGKGRWLTTSLYLFQPEGGWPSGVTFTATVPKGVADTGGGALKDDYSWKFSTKAPSVAQVTPEANTKFFGPNGEIRVTFDQPVDHQSAEQRVSLVGPQGAVASGTTAWDGETLLFRPGAPLNLETAYTATVAAGVKAVRGGGETKEFRWSFTTVGQPRVLSSTPKDGATNHSPFDSLRVTFSNPMDPDSVAKYLTLTPKLTGDWNLGWQESDSQLYLWGNLKPSTRYTLALEGDALDRYGQKLGSPLHIAFSTAPLPPRASLAIPGQVGTFNATGSPTVYVEHTNVSRLDFSLYSLSRADFMRFSTDMRARDQYAPGPSSLVRSWSEKPSSTDRDVSRLTSTALAQGRDGKLSPGFYLLRTRAAENVGDSRLLVVSRLGLTLKQAGKQALVWATDLTSGDVAPNLTIRLMTPAGKSLATGKTDRDGILMVPDLALDPKESGSQIFAFSEGDGDVGAVSSAWTEGIHPFEYNIPWEPYTQPYRGYLFTDRPIYRPAQKVLFKGILRADDDANYTVPAAATEVALQVTDSRGRRVHEATVRLNDLGAFDGEIPLSKDASLGDYHISARIGDWGFGAGFAVAEYRKPEFEAKLSADRDSYLQGEQIAATGTATYYSGQPLADSKVKWQVTSESYLFSAGEEGYQFNDYDLLRESRLSGEKKRTEGQGTTDAQGKFAFQLPTDLSKDLVSQRFILEATLIDPNNQEVSASTEVLVHKGDRYVGLRPERYLVKTGEPATVDLLVADRNKKPVPNSPVTVSFYSRKWLSVKEKQPDGTFLWSSKAEDTLLGSQQVTTDAAGKTKASLPTKDSGSVRVVAEVTDPAGNMQRSATYVYASGSGYAAWRMESNDRVDLVLDKSEYSPGETARVMIPSPVENALALVTVERGKVLSYKLLKLKGNSETLEIPVEKSYLPNVFVSAVLFKGSAAAGGVPTFKLGYGKLNVNVADKKLTLAITADKARYEPGEQATYTLKTSDASGKGVPAELSLAVVDAAVLSLADDNSMDMLQGFWGQRGLGVSTSATLSQSIDRHNADLPGEKKGAGGGSEDTTVRREFPDTAYWNPSLRTDDKGEARVTMKLPDSLTTWRATARGVTAATQVGNGSLDVVASKSLLLRPALPRFLLMGDRLSLATSLYNYTDKEVEVEVSLAAKGVQPATGNSFAPQRVRVPAGEGRKLEWPARVETVAGGDSKATVSFSAKPVTSGVHGDAVEVALPVLTLTTAEVVATSGEVRDSTTELVRVPEGVNPALGELTVEASPSLAAGMRYSARFLDEFPYECTEQTVSRFLPRVVMQRAFDKVGFPDRENIADKLPVVVTRSLQRLYTGQRPDGGWGWWPGDSSDQWITAYVVQGLSEARRSGHTVDQGVVDRATQYLRRSLDARSDAEHPENPNSRAYLLYALAQAGKGDVGLTNALFDRRSTLGNYGKAYLLLALQSLGAGKQDGKLQSLLSDLTSGAIASATGSHWEEKTVDYRTMNSNTRSTAVVLDALVRTSPENPLIASTVRWLMVARKEGHWETTQETAMSLLALTDYLEVSKELQADFAYRISLNGKELATETVKPENVDEAKRLVVEVKNLLAGADNKVELTRGKASDQSGDGRLYYTMYLRSFQPAGKVPAVAEGLALVREYYRLDNEAAGPVMQVAAGETVKVKLTLLAMQDMHYLAVEDPLPSGLEAVDTRLKTTSLAAREQTGMVRKEEPEKQTATGSRLSPGWWSHNYFNYVEPRDDRVAIFATYLPKGSYEYSYLARATTSGEFQALPTRGYEMYFPEIWGRSEGGTFTVTGR